MFESLDDQMRNDARCEKTTKELVIQGLVITVLALTVFAGLVFGIRMLG